MLWVSAAPISDPVATWTGCQRRQSVTGLRPVLCYPDLGVSPVALALVDAVDLEHVLEQAWLLYREAQLAWLAAPPMEASVPPEVARFIEPFEDDPGAPFDEWPGLAPAAEQTADHPDEVARRVFAHWMADNPYPVEHCHLALVAAARSADIPAVLGWDADAPIPLLCALLRSWEDRFGARVIAVVGSTVHVSVAHPPRTEEQALHLALEHVLTTADSVIKDPPVPYEDYAASLIGNHLWSFWWD